MSRSSERSAPLGVRAPASRRDLEAVRVERAVPEPVDRAARLTAAPAVRSGLRCATCGMPQGGGEQAQPRVQVAAAGQWLAMARKRPLSCGRSAGAASRSRRSDGHNRSARRFRSGPSSTGARSARRWVAASAAQPAVVHQRPAQDSDPDDPAWTPWPAAPAAAATADNVAVQQPDAMARSPPAIQSRQRALPGHEAPTRPIGSPADAAASAARQHGAIAARAAARCRHAPS